MIGSSDYKAITAPAPADSLVHWSDSAGHSRPNIVNRPYQATI